MNLVNGKLYVGYAKKMSKRINEHKGELRRQNHSNDKLQKSYDKHGVQSFSFEVLEEYPEHLLVAMGHYWCTILNTHDERFGYNIAPTNPYQNSPSCSLQTRMKISTKGKGRRASEETKKRMSIAFKGLSKGIGRRLSQEHREKISKNKRKKKLLQFNLDMTFVRMFNCLTAAGEKFPELNLCNVSVCCSNKVSFSQGFVWRYAIESTKVETTLSIIVDSKEYFYSAPKPFHDQPKSEKAYRAKLSNDQVESIRKEYQEGSIKQWELGKKYNVSQSQISHIILNKAFKETNLI